MQPSIILK